MKRELEARITNFVNRKLGAEYERKIHASIAHMFANIDTVIEEILTPAIKKIVLAHAGIENQWGERYEVRGGDHSSLVIAIKQKGEVVARKLMEDMEFSLTQKEMAELRKSAKERFASSAHHTVQRRVEEIISTMVDQQAQQIVDELFKAVEEKSEEETK